jgi:hypothetical protein
MLLEIWKGSYKRDKEKSQKGFIFRDGGSIYLNPSPPLKFLFSFEINRRQKFFFFFWYNCKRLFYVNMKCSTFSLLRERITVFKLRGDDCLSYLIEHLLEKMCVLYYYCFNVHVSFFRFVVLYFGLSIMVNYLNYSINI